MVTHGAEGCQGDTVSKKNTARKPAYEIINHGWSHSQYFPGCGIAFTEFEYVVTGIGDNAKEAYEDAVEIAYQTHNERQGAILDKLLPTRPRGIRKTDAVPYDDPDLEPDEDYAGGDLFWYVSIRYTLVE